MKTDYFKKQAETLEDAFFREHDRKLIEKQKKLREMEQTKDSLSKVSGIKNDKVLTKLVELSIKPETLTSVSLIPLIEVAWADGVITSEEKKGILEAAAKLNINPGDISYVILQQWLDKKPSSDLFEAWSHYIEGLCEQMSNQEKKGLRDEICNQIEILAKAGRFLGWIPGTETVVIDRIRKVFK